MLSSGVTVKTTSERPDISFRSASHGKSGRVDVASNGREAVALAKSADDSLALMDMQMPLMSGLEATREIRTFAHWNHCPIIAFTANAFDDGRQACLTSGMDDFITKPVQPAPLFSMVRKWLDSGARHGKAEAPAATSHVADLA